MYVNAMIKNTFSPSFLLFSISYHCFFFVRKLRKIGGCNIGIPSPWIPCHNYCDTEHLFLWCHVTPTSVAERLDWNSQYLFKRSTLVCCDRDLNLDLPHVRRSVISSACEMNCYWVALRAFLYYRIPFIYRILSGGISKREGAVPAR